MSFQMLDRIIQLEPGRRLVARKRFRRTEPFFVDHFPGLPVVPGVLLTEVMVQAGGWLIVGTFNFAQWPLLCMLEGVKFRALVGPEEELEAACTVVDLGKQDHEIKGCLTVQGRRVAEARIFYHSFSPLNGPTSSFDATSFLDWSRSTFDALGGEEALRHGRDGAR
jgi:3-hydroxyacyl-[acyl-carrier-protein] dehydratase